MFKETGGGVFMEAKGLEKGDKAKVGKFTRLLEAVHRLIYAKDDVVGLAGGVGFKKGKEIKAGENVRGELVAIRSRFGCIIGERLAVPIQIERESCVGFVGFVCRMKRGCVWVVRVG